MSVFALASVLFFLLFPLALAATQSSCKPGTFFSSNKCKRCPPGTYQPLPATTACLPCPAGTFNIFRGAQGVDLCEPCIPNTFNPSRGATTPSRCRKCPSGTVSVSGSARCVTCPPGTSVTLPDRGAESYSRGYDFCRSRFNRRSRNCYAGSYPRRTRCTPCPKGTFSTTSNALSCTRCPSGQFATAGSTSCVGCDRPGIQCVQGKGERPCMAAQFNDGSVQECSFCPPGMIGNMRIGATRCVPCPPGTFKSSHSGGCRPCNGDRFLALNQTRCFEGAPNTPCPSNFFLHAAGFCSQCGTNERLNKGKKICVECPANRISNGGIDTKCRPCPANAKRARGAPSCACEPGYRSFSTTTDFECEPCPAGTRWSGGCFPCRPGTFSATPGNVECRPCKFNFVQPLPGQTKCERCPRGMVPNAARGCVSSATNCLPGEKRIVDANNIVVACSVTSCPENTYMVNLTVPSPDNVQYKTCFSCTDLQKYDPMRNGCERCPRDKPFSNGGTSTECFNIDCGPGDFFVDSVTRKCRCNGEIVNGECRRCQQMLSSSETNMCTPCPIGTFAHMIFNRVECRLCSPGMFNDVPGATECKTCPPGTVALYLGSANCVTPRRR